ncbi:MAG: hypothetical protein HQK69_11260 [Desulfamplus sp.]|nr:hypothetical protein [Desulfamplus sp.]
MPELPSGNCFFDEPNSRTPKSFYFDQLIDYIVGGCCTYPSGSKANKPNYVGTDGWYLELPPGERNLGQATLLGGLVTFATYKTDVTDICLSSGESFLYALYYQTGTSWYESIFNTDVGLTQEDPPTVLNRLELGNGLALTPNLHVGRADGTKAFVQTSTGAIVEIRQPTLPIKETKSRRNSWQCN